MRVIKLALIIAGLSSSAHTNTVASEPDRAPLANAVGRFWGFGYSAGYHARYESRFGWYRHVPAMDASGPTFPRAHLPSLSLPGAKMFSVFDNSGTSPALHAHGWPIGQSRDCNSETVPDYVPRRFEPAPKTILESGAARAAVPVVPTAPTPAATPTAPLADGWMRRMLKPHADAPNSTTNRADAQSPSDRSAPGGGNPSFDRNLPAGNTGNNRDLNSRESIDGDRIDLDASDGSYDDLLSPGTKSSP